MAKKNEFRPDKSGKGLLERFHLTRQQRQSLLKWVLYAFLLTLLSVLQDVIFSQLRINGAATDLVPCGIFLVCLAEGTERGCIFALISSLLFLFSGTAPGPYAMVLSTFLAVGVTAFRQGYLQQGFFASMLCVTVAMAVYELGLFAIGLFLRLTTPARLLGFLITAGLSLLAAPVLYGAVRFISRIGGSKWEE